MSIVIGITGSIAAVKSIELIHKLTQLGHKCKVILTKDGEKFVTMMSLASMGADVYVEDKLNACNYTQIMEHINLARWADYILIVPASANTIAKLAHGFADNILTATVLASDSPKILIPAMNQQMWKSQVTQNNIANIKQLGFKVWGPASGLQACGDIDVGRMIEVEEILDRLKELSTVSLKLKGKHIVITAGGTVEPLDPVRYISNHSSGKMGYALAQIAVSYGADVTLIYGKTTQDIPNGVKTAICTMTAETMLEASIQYALTADVFIGCAAVCDYKINTPNQQKIKKSEGNLTLELVKNPDIIAMIKKLYPQLFVVGFAAETQDVINYAIQKLDSKDLDMIIANDVSNGVFGSDVSQVIIIDKQHNLHKTQQLPKLQLAEIILDNIKI